MRFSPKVWLCANVMWFDLAMHFERGQDDYRRAVKYLQQAAENALQRCANREAIGHLTKGLALLKALPDTPERAQQELMLQIALGAVLVATKGYAALEVEHAYTRARELCQQGGATPQLFLALVGLWRFYIVRGRLQTAQELAEQLLGLAQHRQDLPVLLAAHTVLGVTLFHLGELARARAHLEQGIALYDPQQHRSLIFLQGDDPGLTCLSWVAWALCFLGYPDQALKRNDEALALAQELAYPFSLAAALDFAARVHQFHQEGQSVQEQVEAAITLCTEQGFPLFLAMGTIMWGWALVEQGQAEEGLVQIQQGLAAFRSTGAEATRSYFLALLAEAWGKMGQAEEGLSVLAEALAAVDNTGERFYEAELYRLRGQLTLQSRQVSGKSQTGLRKSEVPNPQHPAPSTHAEAKAEACFQKAIEIARHQGAKSLELRAVMSLSRLWQKQGKGRRARKLLAEVYGWFTEGLDTTDLQEARALLEELS